MTFDEPPPVVSRHQDATPPAFNADTSTNAEFWQNWMKKLLSEKQLIEEDDVAWQEPEVLIRLEDPAEGSTQGKLFICHHCSFEWDDLSVLRAHIESQHIPKLLSGAALPVEHGEFSEGPEISLIPLSPDRCDVLPHQEKISVDDSKNKNLGNIVKIKKCVECPNCDFKCAKPRTLKKHLRLKHRNTKPFECRFCKFSTFYPKVLKRHTRSKHPGVQPYSCQQCLFSSHEEILLKAHIISEHTNDLLHSCPHCNYVSGQCSALTAHVKIKHPTEEMFQCLQCAVRPAESISSSEGSKTSVKSKPEEAKAGKVHHCGECEYQTTQLAHLKRHIISNHTFERPYRCVHCHYTTARSDHLRKHIINKHANENTYHCTECPFTSPHASDLKLHIKLIHSSYNSDLALFPLSSQFESDTEGLKSSTSDFSTSQQDNLRQHECYRCDYCVFTSYSTEKLKQHMDARHLKQEAHHCLFCAYSAFTPHDLKSHLLAHGWEYDLQ